MPRIIRENLTGPQKSAVLCLALGPQNAARILQQLSPDHVEAVSREIASMPAVGQEVLEEVLGEFSEFARAVDSIAQGGIESAREILEHAMGPQKAARVLERIQEQVVDTGLKRLKKAAPDVLLGILRGEHPQTIALILAHLDVRQAASVVEAMDPELASDVLFRVARMEKISPEMLATVEAGLSSKTDLSLSQEMTLSGGPAAVAKVLNLTGGTLEKQLIDAINSRDQAIGGQIQSLMFVFEDLLHLDPKSMQRILRDVDGKELALALKGSTAELKAHIKHAMSERAAAALDEEIEFLGPVRVRDVEAAHARIIEKVRALEEAGEIILGGAGGNDEIIA